MTLEPIDNASLPIQLHLATVLPALAIGTWQIFFSAKGASTHRALGYVYLALMTITAITTMFIHEINPDGFMGLSGIHLLALLTLWGVYTAVAGARRHDVNRHRGAMLGLYAGILIAGALTFLPGRTMHRMFFE
jgi:uncharacterized membrane protein